MARTRYQAALGAIRTRDLPAAALRAVFREGYGARDLRADVMAGVVVGIIALPLAMALAIAVGVPPQHGLYTSIVAGAMVAILGGSRTQVTGPTAAFEGKHGVWEQVTGPFELGALGGGGTGFGIERTNLKFFPSEYHSQAPLFIAIALREKVRALRESTLQAAGHPATSDLFRRFFGEKPEPPRKGGEQGSD